MKNNLKAGPTPEMNLYHFEYLEYDEEKSFLNKKTYWRMRCKCGKFSSPLACHVIHGRWKSCGCLLKENKLKGKLSCNYKGIADLSGSFWNSLIYKANKRNLELNITKKYIYNLLQKQNYKCALSGINIALSDNRIDRTEFQTASLDRIDSNLGYLENNVQWVHKKINMMKQDYHQEYFIDLCKKISEFKMFKDYGQIKNIKSQRETRKSFKGYKNISGWFWNRIKVGAISRKLEFNITTEQAWDIYQKQNAKCALSGIDIIINIDRMNYTTASLDRINPLIGYTKDNLQWVHLDINFIKHKMQEKEFFYYCDLIAENN